MIWTTVPTCPFSFFAIINEVLLYKCKQRLFYKGVRVAYRKNRAQKRRRNRPIRCRFLTTWMKRLAVLLPSRAARLFAALVLLVHRCPGTALSFLFGYALFLVSLLDVLCFSFL